MTPHVLLDLAAQAGPHRVGAFRRALRRWLSDELSSRQPLAGQSDGADDLADLVGDLVLATSEALENVVDHAFTGLGGLGTMSMHADIVDDVVTIVVADDGRWRPPTAGPTPRGRGITLMRRLTDAEVDHGPDGTTVTMRKPLPRPAHGRSVAAHRGRRG